MRTVLLLIFAVTLFGSCQKDICYECYTIDDVGDIIDEENLCGEDERADYIDVWEDFTLGWDAFCDAV